VIPKVIVSRRVAADERNYVTVGLNSLLIRTGKHNVLVEPGWATNSPIAWSSSLASLRNCSTISPPLAPLPMTSTRDQHAPAFRPLADGTRFAPEWNDGCNFSRANTTAPEGEWEYGQRPSERDGHQLSGGQLTTRW